MIVSYDRAINALYEQVSDFKKFRHNDLLQRRNAVVDIFGYEFEARTSSGLDDPATFRLSLSPDYIYLSRFGFKLEVFDCQATDLQFFMSGIDLTPYFRAQWQGQFANGNGIWPNNQLGRYDILEAAGYMSNKDREALLGAGYKEVRIYGNKGFTVKLYLYEKYNHVGR